MKKLILAVLALVSSSYASAHCGCGMQLTLALSQSEPGFMRLVELDRSEASSMISKSEYLNKEDRRDAAQKAGVTTRLEFFMLETTEYSGVKQEVLIVSPIDYCQITGRYTTYLE